MSLIRPIWNDGQALTTPELQRPNDVAADADDRVHEVLLTPGSVAKRVMPLLEETTSINPRQLVVPSATAAKLKVQPALFVARNGSDGQKVVLSANLQAALNSLAVGNNSSGNPRIDLLYATISRTAPLAIGSPAAGTAFAGVGQADASTGAQQARKIKDVSSGAISTQTLYVYDVPTITLTILAGTPAGSPSAPALPADSATAFNFSLAQIAVANGYAGAAIAQSAITQTWSGQAALIERVGGIRPLSSFYGGAATEKPAGSLPSSDRWGPIVQRFVHLKLVTGTPTSGAGILLDDTIDWRRRIIWGFGFYFGAASSWYPLESAGAAGEGLFFSAGAGNAGWAPMTGQLSGDGASSFWGQYGYNSANSAYAVLLNVDSAGALRFVRGASLFDGTNGDAIALQLFASDQFKAGM